MQYDFDGKTMLITGGGSGLGRATALIAAASGANVVAADLNGDSAEETAALVRDAGCVAKAEVLDVTDRDATKAVVARTVETFGSLDAAFNSAGITGDMGTAPADISAGDWASVINVNLTGLFWSVQAELGVMLAAGKGAIVNAASVAGLILGGPGGFSFFFRG